MMQHTKACQELDTKLKAEYDAWIQKYPKYCIHCNGRGIVGDSEWCEPCVYCTGQPSPCCARCLEPLGNDEGEGPCPSCGWNYDDCLPDDRQYISCLCEQQGLI